MLTNTIYLALLAIAVASANALPTNNSNSSGSWNPNNNNTIPEPNQGPRPDIAQGEVTENSVLIYDEYQAGDDFEWRGHNLISAIEIFRNNNTVANGSIPSPWWWRPEQNGGLNRDFLQLWMYNGEPLDATVKIYSRPANYRLGWTSGHLHVESTVVQGQAPLRFHHNSSVGIVRGIELLDQTDGTGIFVQEVSFGERSIDMLLLSQLFRAQVDYVVNVYSEIRFEDVEVGELTNSSHFLTAKHIRAADLDQDSHSYTFTADDDAHIDYALLRDLSTGNGSQALQATLVAANELQVQFDGARESTAYLLEVYGGRSDNTTDPGLQGGTLVLEVGEMHEGSQLLESRSVIEFKNRSQISFATRRPIDRIEVVDWAEVQRVKVTLLAGEVGGQLVFVQLDAEQRQLIEFTVRAFGRAE